VKNFEGAASRVHDAPTEDTGHVAFDVGVE
jgi:hypothetical protein